MGSMIRAVMSSGFSERACLISNIACFSSSLTLSIFSLERGNVIFGFMIRGQLNLVKYFILLD